MRSFCVPSKTTAVFPCESVVVLGLQAVSDPTAPFFPAPSFALPDPSGTVAPEMFPKSRSMIGPAAGGAPAAAGWDPDAPGGNHDHMHAATSPMPRLTLALSSPSPALVTIVAWCSWSAGAAPLAGPADPSYI